MANTAEEVLRRLFLTEIQLIVLTFQTERQACIPMDKFTLLSNRQGGIRVLYSIEGLSPSLPEDVFRLALAFRRHEFTGMARIEELPEHLKVGALFNGAEGVGGLTTMLAVSPSWPCHSRTPEADFSYITFAYQEVEQFGW